MIRSAIDAISAISSARPARTALTWLLLTALGLTLPATVSAQYFGRNKVQYDDFDFRVLTTEHFDIYYYEAESRAIDDLARMSERWYERFARLFQHEFEGRKPLVIYADHPDFQQTNTLQGFIGESTGGVTESLKDRVILPMTGSYADTDHVLGHELVHAFQFNMAQSRRAGGGIQGLSRLPLWLVEGMAEYLSVGREDPLTAMWLRDAIRRDDFPTIDQLTRDRRFFPYRFGQALWAYIGGTWGDEVVSDIYRRSLRFGFRPAIGQVVGLSTDTLSQRWRRAVEQQYVPLMTGRTDASDVGTRVISEESGGGGQNISPSISPNGRYIAFYSERDLFSIDLYLAAAATGEIIRKLKSADSDPHVDALRYTEASGTWSPDGESFAFAVFEDGDNSIVIIDTDDGDTERRIKPAGIGALNHPAWSPDGRYMAFTGIRGGISDLFLYDLETDELTQLTDDRYADFHPDWSPDGRTLAFSSDRGPETDFETLEYSTFRLATIDVATREVEVLDLFESARHSTPQYAPDGESIYFVSDQDGFSDIYNVELASRTVRRLTRVVTGVSGITPMSPALSVADQTGEIAFSIFSEGFGIHTLPAEAGGLRADALIDEADIRGRTLPPAEPDRFSRVADYLADPITGLPPQDVYRTSEASDYSPSLALDFIGQPSIGVGVADRFGTSIGGGASAFFSDMLGNKLLGVSLQAQGTFQDIGGAVQYADIGDRWNWGGQVSRIPFLLLGFRRGQEDGSQFLGQVRQRIFVSSVSGTVAYPFSQTRRLEFNGGLTRYSYDVEEDRFFLDPSGNFFTDVERVDIDRDCSDLREGDDPLDRNVLCKPDALNLAQVSAAYVGDAAFFAFVGPVRGERFRFEIQQTFGSENFTQGIADYRRYHQVDRNLTLAWRGLHLGRYGSGLDDDLGGSQLGGRLNQVNVIQPFFLGFESLIRGYAFESFDNDECFASLLETTDPETSCPALSRLFGQKLALLNLEARVPLLGVEEFGLINFPFLPTELLVFQDAGLAWTDADEVEFELNTSTNARRVPVFSTGVGARTNILGFLVLESYFAYPWQRPDKGWHWGFHIAPAW